MKVIVNIFYIYFTKLTCNRKIISVYQILLFYKNRKRSHHNKQHLIGAILSDPIVENSNTGIHFRFTDCTRKCSIGYESNHFFAVSNRKWPAAITLTYNQIRKIIFEVWKSAEYQCYYNYQYEMFQTYIASACEKEWVRANFRMCYTKSFLAAFFICERR